MATKNRTHEVVSPESIKGQLEDYSADTDPGSRIPSGCVQSEVPGQARFHSPGRDALLTDNIKFPENADMNLLARLAPLAETALPEEIAAAVVYVASPEARFVTGVTFAIDGGQTAG